MDSLRVLAQINESDTQRQNHSYFATSDTVAYYKISEIDCPTATLTKPLAYYIISESDTVSLLA